MTLRRRMKEQGSLGSAIDARSRRRQQLEQQDSLGGSAAAPLSSGGSVAGGGGAGGDPALPESFVTGLAGGSGNPMQEGELTITGSGAATVSQDQQAGEIDVHAPDYTAGDGLSLTDEEFAVDSTVVRTTGSQSIAGLKTFSTAPRTPVAPTDGDDLSNKDYVDERTKVVHRQVFPAAGSRDSISGNNEINLPWDVSAYPSGASLPSVTIATKSGFQFFSSSPVEMLNSYLEFEWTSAQLNDVITVGMQLGIASLVVKSGTDIEVNASIRVEQVDRIEKIFISVNDENGNRIPVSPPNHVSMLDNDEWSIIGTGLMSLSGLGSILSVVLTLQGTTVASNVGNTKINVSYLEVAQYEI